MAIAIEPLSTGTQAKKMHRRLTGFQQQLAPPPAPLFRPALGQLAVHPLTPHKFTYARVASSTRQAPTA